MRSTFWKNDDESDDEEIVPSSLIDMVFLLLIFFFLTAAASVLSSGELSEVSQKEPEEGKRKVELPSGYTDVMIDRDDIEDVRIFIDETLDGVFNWYILGRGPNTEEFASYTRENLDEARAFSGKIELNSEDHRAFLQEYGSYLQWADDPFCQNCYQVVRYGDVPASTSEQALQSAKIAVFFEYFLRKDQGAGPDQLDVEIMAHEDVSIGFINDIMNICGADSIPKVSFILKQTKQEAG